MGGAIAYLAAALAWHWQDSDSSAECTVPAQIAPAHGESAALAPSAQLGSAQIRAPLEKNNLNSEFVFLNPFKNKYLKIKIIHVIAMNFQIILV